MSKTKQPPEGEIIFYTTPAGVTRVEAFLQDDIFWLSQRRMSEPFGVEVQMRMADWVQKLDAFLQFNEYEVLTNAGRVSHAVAKQLAEDAYSRFRVIQDQAFESDFEREAKQLTGKKEQDSGRIQ